MNYKNYIKTVEDFPTKGISFKDITPLMHNGEVFRAACHELAQFAREVGTTVIVGPESRGFIFGCPVACELAIGFIPIRKPGKLPREVVSKEYALEYGTNTLCMHKDAVKKGDKVLIVDDLLATGGTVRATIDLVKELGATVVGIACLIELSELGARKILNDVPIKVLIKY